MDTRKIAGFCFLLAMIFAVLLLLGVQVPFIPRGVMAYSVIGLGIVAILINLLNVNKSKHNIAYSIVYWIACLLSLVGIGMLTIHLPFAKEILYLGFGTMLISFFIPKERKEEKKNGELLDDF
jgi:hypothetical protein